MRNQDNMLQNLIAEQAAEWHVALTEGGLDKQHTQEFMRWLRASPVHVAEYLKIVGVANQVAHAARDSSATLQELLAEADTPPIRKLLPDADERFGMDGMLSPRAYRKPRMRGVQPHHARRLPAARWTAAVAAILVVSIVLLAGWHWYAMTPNIETFSTRHGELRSFRLPDNTQVQLDSDSAITVRFSRSERHVIVNCGQAYFQVTRHGGRPFDVRAGRALIHDVGTAFDVYRRHAATTVSVAEGRVQVWSMRHPRIKTRYWLSWFEPEGQPSGKPVADLVAGQQVKIADTGYVVALGPVNLQQTLDWRHGRIAFDNEAITEVAARFNRYNSLQIVVEGQRIGKLPISGVFDAHGVSTFIAFLDSLPGVRTERRGSRIFVYASNHGGRHHD